MIDLSEQQKKWIREILSRHVPRHKIWVFGSRITGKAKKYSDLDLALIGSPLSSLTLSTMKEAFSKSDLPFTVDIIEWNKISTEFQSVIKSRYEEWPN